MNQSFTDKKRGDDEVQRLCVNPLHPPVYCVLGKRATERTLEISPFVDFIFRTESSSLLWAERRRLTYLFFPLFFPRLCFVCWEFSALKVQETEVGKNYFIQLPFLAWNTVYIFWRPVRVENAIFPWDTALCNFFHERKVLLFFFHETEKIDIEKKKWKTNVCGCVVKFFAINFRTNWCSLSLYITDCGFFSFLRILAAWVKSLQEGNLNNWYFFFFFCSGIFSHFFFCEMSLFVTLKEVREWKMFLPRQKIKIIFHLHARA